MKHINLLIYTVMWDVYFLTNVDMQLDRCTVWPAYMFRGLYVKFIYTRAPDHTVDCSEFLKGIYSDIVFSYLHMNWYS